MESNLYEAGQGIKTSVQAGRQEDQWTGGLDDFQWSLITSIYMVTA